VSGTRFLRFACWKTLNARNPSSALALLTVIDDAKTQRRNAAKKEQKDWSINKNALSEGTRLIPLRLCVLASLP
jgi:hypothetical protein